MLLKKVCPVSWRNQARAAPCAPIPAPLPAPACLPSWQTHLCFSYGLINPSMWQTLHLAIMGHQIVGSQLETQRFSKFPHLQPAAHVEKGGLSWGTEGYTWVRYHWGNEWSWPGWFPTPLLPHLIYHLVLSLDGGSSFFIQEMSPACSCLVQSIPATS